MGGKELAIPSFADQELGNPLLLKRALDHGVRVIVAHYATYGKGIDFDHPKRRRVSYFDLFICMMDKPEYKDLLHGDLASVTQLNQMKYLSSLIELSQPGNVLSGRIVNGSDYPLPAFNALISTRLLRRMGYISSEEQSGLNEIYCRNPLLFDLVLKRILRHPQTQQQIPPEAFLLNANLDVLM